MDAIWEKAREVGRLVGQSEEYRALKRANDRLSDDREAVTRLNRLADLQDSFTESLRRGEEPPEADQEEYERLASEIQGHPGYQAMASAQANFERLMARVNEEIARGIEAAEQSRIILPG